jgi:hypothetical protein
MTTLLTRALTEASRRLAALPASEQDAVARRLLDQLDRWQALRAHIEAAEKSGPAESLDIEAVIAKARQRRRRKKA